MLVTQGDPGAAQLRKALAIATCWLLWGSFIRPPSAVVTHRELGGSASRWDHRGAVAQLGCTCIGLLGWVKNLNPGEKLSP